MGTAGKVKRGHSWGGVRNRNGETGVPRRLGELLSASGVKEEKKPLKAMTEGKITSTLFRAKTA